MGGWHCPTNTPSPRPGTGGKGQHRAEGTSDKQEDSQAKEDAMEGRTGCVSAVDLGKEGILTHQKDTLG